jgi:hypothetical protein
VLYTTDACRGIKNEIHSQECGRAAFEPIPSSKHAVAGSLKIFGCAATARIAAELARSPRSTEAGLARNEVVDRWAEIASEWLSCVTSTPSFGRAFTLEPLPESSRETPSIPLRRAKSYGVGGHGTRVHQAIQAK